MIVSGFTQRRSNGPIMEADIPGLHIHCFKCHRVNCSKFADNVSTCAMTVCELCGWRCHGCKLPEHAMTCPEERVPCLNRDYGCPHVIKRCKMAGHLPVCPASVVFCAEEWSRWPMHAREQGVRMPLPQEKSCLECGQLDVGLAMRDQRMLIDSLRAPRKLRHTLQNSLTQKYPAAPFPHWRTSPDSDTAVSDATSQAVSDDESDAPWDLSKPHPGLKESIRSRLYRVTKETADSLAAALEVTTGVLSTHNRLSGLSDADGGSIHDGKEGTAGSNPDFSQTSSSLDHVSPTASKNDLLSISTKMDLSDCFVNKTLETNAEGNSDGKLPRLDVVEGAGQLINRPSRNSSGTLDRYSDPSSKSTLHDIGGTQLHKLMGLTPGEGKDDELCLHKMLGVCINIECINKYVIKPSSMYTFICAQNFRRDEYPWHFKNVHLEIHTGFCGWLEQRCPLANLGCTFSFHRMEPAQPNSFVYHSWLQESFGLRSTTQPNCAPRDSRKTISKSKSALNIAGTSLSQLGSEIESPKVSQGNISQINDFSHNVCVDNSDPMVSARFSISNFDKEGQLVSQPDVDTTPAVYDELIGVDNNLSKKSCCNFQANTCLGNHHLQDDTCPSSLGNRHLQDDTCPSGLGNHHLQDDTCPSSLGIQHLQDDTCPSSLGIQHLQDDTSVNSNLREPSVQSNALPQQGSSKCQTVSFMRVQPTIYTASSWDSKVLFRYDLEADGDDEETDFHSLVDLPFEILRHIARHLDSFSLCNLSLTCHQFRDVCCSLLDDYGIVLLNWQKQRQELSGKVTWKVVSKRWMFSTSFEPIQSWRFVASRPTIGDHLKVCPFNEIKLCRTEPVKLLMSAPDQIGPRSEESIENVGLHLSQK